MPTTTYRPEQLADVGAPQGPPPRIRLLSDLDTAVQPARLALASRRLLSAPRGTGRTTVVLPGWKAPEASVRPIVAYLATRNHAARTWGLGVNTGEVEQLRDTLIERLRRVAQDDGRAINLVGWSLGGVIAREIARALPDEVHRVVTYGSPAVGGPTHTIGAANAGPEECARITALQEELDANDPIRVPVTAIFTRRDGAVDWRSCIDRSSRDVTMVEVGSGHVALGFDPDVWLAVAGALAE